MSAKKVFKVITRSSGDFRIQFDVLRQRDGSYTYTRVIIWQKGQIIAELNDTEYEDFLDAHSRCHGEMLGWVVEHIKADKAKAGK